MERMEGVDAGYLYMETPSQHMHTLKVAILEREGGVDVDAFGAEVLARLDRLPPFGRRMQEVPLRLNHPVWVADRPLDSVVLGTATVVEHFEQLQKVVVDGHRR